MTRSLSQDFAVQTVMFYRHNKPRVKIWPNLQRVRAIRNSEGSQALDILSDVVLQILHYIVYCATPILPVELMSHSNCKFHATLLIIPG